MRNAAPSKIANNETAKNKTVMSKASLSKTASNKNALNKTAKSKTAKSKTAMAEPAKPALPTPRAADRIRASARELFYREGIRAVGVDEIVQRAGVTKPSLYRAFPSKDELAAAYLRDYDREFWPRFESFGGKDPGNARAQVLGYISDLTKRAVHDGYRGCGLSNAAVEYPGHTHPARQVAETHKKAFRKRLRELAAAMGARDANALGDGLLLLIEGIYTTGQQSAGGPAQSAVAVAEALIDASLKPARRR